MAIGILGGGLTGMALKYFLPDACVLEKESRIGGLCRTMERDGFSYDLGGHILYSGNPETLKPIEVAMGNRLVAHRRNNAILYRNRFVRYPFENGLPDLPLRDRLACAAGYILRPRIRPENFGEWIVARFGRGIAKRYLTPYNEKIWKTPLRDISTGWVERVPDPPLTDILKGALGIRTEGYLHQLNFVYPKRGGIEALPRAFAGEGHDIHCNYTVRHIEASQGGWTVSDGNYEHRFERIVSTLPAPDLIGAMTGVPGTVREAAEDLRYNQLITVMVGTHAKGPTERLGIYCPQSDAIFNRVCFPTYLESDLAPDGMTSMVAEITLPPGDPLLAEPDDAFRKRVIDDLTRLGFTESDDIVATDIKRVQYAYVVDTHDRKGRMEIVRKYLEEIGVPFCGRFADFEYLNMDACVGRAKETAERTMRG